MPVGEGKRTPSYYILSVTLRKEARSQALSSAVLLGQRALSGSPRQCFLTLCAHVALPACTSSHWASSPCCICGIPAGRQSSSLTLLSCGSHEHQAVLRLLEDRQLQKPHTAGTATQSCLQRTLLAFSSAVVQEEKDPGKDRKKAKSPQTSNPPQPSLV